MIFTKTWLRYLLIAALLFFTMKNNSYAGGFPVRPGSLLLSPSVSYFYANKGWDSLRRLSPFASNGRFQSIGYSLYMEYGISKRFTLVANVPYVMNNYQDDNYNIQTNGLADLEAGVRYYLANINYIYYFTVQGTVITPLYNKNINLGYGQTGAELKFSFAGSGKLFNRNYYFTVDDAVRQYFGSTGPLQDKYTGTFGLTLDRHFKHQLSASIGGIYSTSSFTAGYDPAHIASNKNFAFNQVSLSYGYSFNRHLSLFLSAGKFINGRNTGDGTSASAAIIIRAFK